MSASALLLVVSSCILAAAGQMFLKLGSTGAVAISDYANPKLLLGLVLYGASTVLWIAALAKLPLSKVYPFTILTFVLVYLLSTVVIGEPVGLRVTVGAVLVLAGLFVIASA